MSYEHLEREITNQIIRALRADGYSVIVKTHGSSFQIAGLPDLIVIAKGGRFVGLEVKRPTVGRATALQLSMLHKINVAGGYGVIVRSVEDACAAMASAEAKEELP